MWPEGTFRIGPAFMHSLFKLRGIILNAGRACPACGAETMRTEAPLGLKTPLRLTGGHYRFCRRCLRCWIAYGARESRQARAR
ncbi:MAG TPA: hypothetical protein VFE05_15580 [Longimicrobiaceae bacterium]|nr:hypothetical protein [Longimicrobiaceae bacterium]